VSTAAGIKGESWDIDVAVFEGGLSGGDEQVTDDVSFRYWQKSANDGTFNIVECTVFVERHPETGELFGTERTEDIRKCLTADDADSGNCHAIEHTGWEFGGGFSHLDTDGDRLAYATAAALNWAKRQRDLCESLLERGLLS
jgi:hypothetical protein